MIVHALNRVCSWGRADRSHDTFSALNRRRARPAVESLEGRRLLSFYLGPAVSRQLSTSAGVFQIQTEGAGAFKVHPAGGGAIDLVVFGTNVNSTVSITQIRPPWHRPARFLPIRKLVVVSGELGNLVAPPVELTGKMTPLVGSVASIDLGALGQKSQVDLSGGLGDLTVNNVVLGPTGHFVVSQDLNTQNPSSLLPLNGGPTSTITIGSMTLDGGRFMIGPDTTGPFAVNSNLTITHDGVLSITRDIADGLTIGGNLVLSNGGQIVVGRNLTGLSVGGNLLVSQSNDGIAVGGALTGLVVGGYMQGQGGTTAPTTIDVGVGLNLSLISIAGGVSGVGGLINANITAGGSISGVNVPYGIVQSTLTPNSPPA